MASAGLVVIGSGPAGVSAADAFRQHNPQVPVRIVTEDAAAPYFRPPLSKEYLRGDDSDINLHPADWFDNHSIALTRNSTVCDIDITGKTVIDTTVSASTPHQAASPVRRQTVYVTAQYPHVLLMRNPFVSSTDAGSALFTSR